MPSGMPKDTWRKMEAYLRGIDAALGQRPNAVLVISAHWLTPRPTFGGARVHSLLFDYYNFPDYTYQLTYPVLGAPDIAAHAAELLAAAGIASDRDDMRGIDHGVFVPFKLIYPDADVPIVPMSLQQDLDPAAHLAIGTALAPLRDEGVLIVGSGMSFHNMRALMTGTNNADAVVFDDWLAETAIADPATRAAGLAHWAAAPSGRVSHPQEEHLMPLMIAAGAAVDEGGSQSYSDVVMGKALSGFMFGKGK